MTMAQRGKFGVKLTLQKFMLVALAAVAFQVKPSSAFCACQALAYCSVVSLTDLILSGSITKSCLEVHEAGSSSTTGGQDNSFFVSEYTLKIDHVYKDEVDFTVPVTPSTIDFTSSGYGLESCRLDLDVDTEYVVGITLGKDGSFSSNRCSVTRAVDDLTEEEIAALEGGGCNTIIEATP